MQKSQDDFKSLFCAIQKCQKCPNVQSEKVIRVFEKTNIHATAMVISEAMAASQVRLSWINFFDENGNIGSTGKMLEKFLSKLGFSVYPWKENTIYNTEIVHCFPGYVEKSGEKSIRRPADTEIENCLGEGFIEQEIQLLSPKIIFLMGKTSYETFYKKFLGAEVSLGLTEKIESIKQLGIFDEYKGIPVVPIQHASGANPRYNVMLKDEEYVRLARLSILKRSLFESFSKETAYYPDRFDPSNPSFGHCSVVALIVQDIFGGKILYTKATLPNGERFAHYYNVIEGKMVDFTREQFPEGTTFIEAFEKTEGYKTPREFMLSFEDTMRRYEVLRGRVNH